MADTTPTESTVSTEAPSRSDSVASPSSDGYSSLIFIVVIWGFVLYFFFMRPQKKKDSARKQMLSALKKGDRVVTIGGMHGVVTQLDEDTVSLKVDDKTNSTIKFQRAAINDIPLVSTTSDN